MVMLLMFVECVDRSEICGFVDDDDFNGRPVRPSSSLLTDDGLANDSNLPRLLRTTNQARLEQTRKPPKQRQQLLVATAVR